MIVSRRAMLGGVASAPFLLRRAHADQPKIKVGVLTDLSGAYRETAGQTSVVCARQAVEDFTAAGGKLDVEVISADHRNDAERATLIARAWYDKADVDLIVDLPNSSVALAVADVAREKNKVMITSCATALALTGDRCSPNTIVWSFDNFTLAKSAGMETVRRGGDSWFFITADYVFGRTLEEQTTAVVTKAGAKVVGHARYPFPETTDFAPYLKEAAASEAKVIAFANAGNDTLNCVMQAQDMGLVRAGKQLVSLLLYITNVHALGLEAANGLIVTETFYWDMNERTRAFTNRVRSKTPNNLPNQAHAGTYASVLHYLKAVDAMGAGEAKRNGRATVERMKQTPTSDDAFGEGSIREDGRGLFPAFLFRVKTPAESSRPWDLYDLISTTPADQAARPLGQTGCKLVRV